MSKLITLLITLFTVGLLVGFVNKRDESLVDLNLVVDSCSQRGESRSKFIHCIYQQLSTLRTSQSTLDLMTSLESISTTNPIFKENLTLCHDVSHAIGQFASKTNRNVGRSLSECSVICTAGCFHGVIEGYVAKQGEIGEDLMQVCERNQFDDERKYRACVHGLGHGIASLLGGNVYGALQMCDKLRDNYRLNCGAGVIMELYEPGSFDHVKLSFPEDILELCESFWGVYQKFCEETAGAHELSRSKNYLMAVSICNRVNIDNKVQCATELGSHFYHASDWLDENGENRCEMFSGKMQIACLTGIVSASKNADPDQVIATEMCLMFKDSIGELCE